MTEDDEHLVELCREQLPYRTDAFEGLVRRYEPMVLRSCAQYLRDPEEAQEATQDIFLRVFQALGRFEGRSSFRTWLFRIVRNACSTRRTRMIERGRKEASYVQELKELEGSRGFTGTAAIDQEARVSEVFAELSEDDRESLTLRFIAELSLEEIAETLDIGLSAAKMRVYRATERFRQIYRKK